MVGKRADSILVFAYGSNMLTCRMCGRCQSATAIGVAELRGFEIRWHKKSTDGSGKCDVVESERADAAVYGVLYQIADNEKSRLDEAEGLGKGYEEKKVEVFCNDKQYKAIIYSATAIDKSLKPYTWYKALVVAGAMEHGLQEAYISELQSVEAIPDYNHERHDAEMECIEDVKGAER